MFQVLVGSGWKTRPFRFESERAETLFDRAVKKPSGDVVLWDVVRVGRELGLSIPYDIEPRSRYTPEMLVKPLLKYKSGGIMGAYDKEALDRAVSRVGRMFYVGKLTPVRLSRVLYEASSNAGAPSFEKKDKLHWAAIEEAEAILRGMSPPPLAVFHRGKDTDVVRPVFAYPFSMQLLEGMFFYPFQGELIKHHSPYVGGVRYPDVAALVDEMRHRSSYVVEMDYSGFDGSISGCLISKAFGIIARNFEFTPEQLKAWEKIKCYFVTAPWLCPDGQLYYGRRHGVPSGSMFTQLIDTIVNAIVLEYIKIREHVWTSRYMMLGDDSVIGVIGSYPSLKNWALRALELGITINLEKSKVRRSDDHHVYFLGHYWDKWMMTRDIEQTWLRALAPERVDIRLFSEDESERKQAVVERLRAYQDDNPAAFMELQKVINLYAYGDVRIGWSRSAIFDFKHHYAYLERSSWDPSMYLHKIPEVKFLRPLTAF